jgi:hypothetical protein
VRLSHFPKYNHSTPSTNSRKRMPLVDLKFTGNEAAGPDGLPGNGS